mgnify:CR=1 FL=1
MYKSMNYYHILAAVALILMGTLMVYSVSEESLTFDELAHIAAGFGYLKEQDYRLNAEHPPLVKYLAALGADLAVKPYFPTDTAPWQNETKNQWAQWDHGTIFLYQSNNDADAIIFWARVPMMILTLLLGILLYTWSYRRFGGQVALLATALYAFSPTVLAHGRYVTTDIGATIGFFIGITSYVSFLKSRTWAHVCVAGAAFGIAQLLKFSLILLIPMYGILLILWAWSHPEFISARKRFATFGTGALQTIGIGIIGILVVWVAYADVTARYPLDRNLRDASTLLSTYRFRSHVAFTESLIQNLITRPLGQYLTGVLLANQRAAGGNTTYFLGTVSSKGSVRYFPLLYIVKEQIILHALTLLAVVCFLLRVWKRNISAPILKRIRIWIGSHLELTGALVVISVYWGISLISPLNIGLRHVLPTFPFIYILVAYGAYRFVTIDALDNQRVRHAYVPALLSITVSIIATSIAVKAYPYYLSYYNAFGAGTENGYRIAVDSNYDWGQDFKRLRVFMNEHDIEKISLDYFGGASRDYYLPGRVDGWWSARGMPHGYFAISSTLREGALAAWNPALTPPKPEEAYPWLRDKEPIARAGMSIFIYKFE